MGTGDDMRGQTPPSPEGRAVADDKRSDRGRGGETPRSYRLFDRLTEGLLLCMLVVSPWLFGGTPAWAVWGLNAGGYLLGLLWLAKRIIRWRTGYVPPRWGELVPAAGQPALFRPPARLARWLTRSLAFLTLVILLYCLTSACNARAWWINGIQVFNERYLPWLPHSYAGLAAWASFWQYLGLAAWFWAARDWLLGKTPAESGEEPDFEEESASAGGGVLPRRLARLLWVLTLNGAALTMVSILQRMDGTDRLLWLLKPKAGAADFHFGPFAYRGNAAQYLNLLWPVSFAFWWSLFRRTGDSRRAGVRVGGQPHLVLLPCVLVMAAGPFISASHGGAVMTAGLAAGALAILVAASWQSSPAMRLAMFAPVVIGVMVALYLGTGQFRNGLLQAFMDDMGDRVEIHETARQMAVDRPLFGTGPGSFARMYQLYRSDPRETWAAYAHNDWLQTLITFGWAGSALVALALLHVFLRWWVRDGIECPWDLIAMIWLSLAGCLAHACYDFPLQIHSILLLFLTLCGVACCCGRKV